VARHALPDLGPWKRWPLVIPPDSLRAWVRLALWESWMGMLLCVAVVIGIRLIATAQDNIITVTDSSGVYKAGMMNVVFSVWCGVLLLTGAAWLVFEVWNATLPKPITDDFLKMLDDSFGRDWRHLRTWPWARMAWAYGFTLLGAALTLWIGLLISV
jgi:hypothetical protein